MEINSSVSNIYFEIKKLNSDVVKDKKITDYEGLKKEVANFFKYILDSNPGHLEVIPTDLGKKETDTFMYVCFHGYDTEEVYAINIYIYEVKSTDDYRKSNINIIPIKAYDRDIAYYLLSVYYDISSEIYHINPPDWATKKNEENKDKCSCSSDSVCECHTNTMSDKEFADRANELIKKSVPIPDKPAINKYGHAYKSTDTEPTLYPGNPITDYSYPLYREEDV
jgi:hypothetical protein